MKQKILFTLLLTAFATLSAFAQKSMLVAYNGGYFVKNDKGCAFGLSSWFA